MYARKINHHDDVHTKLQLHYIQTVIFNSLCSFNEYDI